MNLSPSIPRTSMLFSRTIITAAMLGATLVGSAAAQTTVKTGNPQAVSPHVKSTWNVSGATIANEYGRPYLKGRPEAMMMPVGQPWRTGADEATLITSNKPLTFGSITLTPGTYTINTQPGEKD